jgi:hypothetical protein
VERAPKQGFAVKKRTCLASIILLAATTVASPAAYAQGHNRLERQDAVFAACIEARGYTDRATALCYAAAYNEASYIAAAQNGGFSGSSGTSVTMHCWSDGSGMDICIVTAMP